MTELESNAGLQQRELDLMRFGWALAELRGRLYFGDQDPGRLIPEGPPRANHALPISEERSPKELLIENKKVVTALAKRTCLDGLPTLETTLARSLSAVLLNLADKVPEKTTDPSHEATWNAFCDCLYGWDADIQDALASMSYGESAAYQIGRGLAECSWALDSRTSADEIMGWTHVLGSIRCVALTRLLETLGSYVPHLTGQAIKGSIAHWQRLAADPAWRCDPTAPIFLRQQVSIWKDLLLAEVDPHVFELPQNPLKKFATILPILRSLWPQLACGFISVMTTAWGAWIFTRHSTGVWGEMTFAAGIFGITGSSLATRAKATTNSLMNRLRSAVEADEVVRSVTRTPPRPKVTDSIKPRRLVSPGSVGAQLTLATIPIADIVASGSLPIREPSRRRVSAALSGIRNRLPSFRQHAQ